jgi:Bifunctional DNA primase/polymerase, N-terminal
MTTRILGPRPDPGNAKLLTAALAYATRGWSIIPVIGKKAAGGWKRLQKQAAEQAELRKMFAKPGVTGIAVILGTVSGGLAVRDFDCVEAYDAWAKAYPDHAARLPTVQTARGFHVYFRVTDEVFRTFDDASGELRGDSKHIVVLPPSLHPDGAVYRWLIPLPDVDLPFVDPYEAGLCDREYRVDRANTVDRAATRPHAPPALLLAPTLSSLLQEEIEKAFAATLPSRLGQRYRCIFRLARELKGIESLSIASIGDLRHIVKEWHERALPVIGTKPFLETWADFVQAWNNVRVPAGQGAIEIALERAMASVPPQRVVELYTENENEIILLVKVCRELQLIAGDKEFFLDCRTAGKMIGAHPTTAWRYLEVLVADGILMRGDKGSFEKRRASRFRFIDQEPR